MLGVLSEANQNLAWMEHSKTRLLDARTSFEDKVLAGGEMFYTAFNVMSFGGLEQTRQGLMQGDLLMAASGALQMVPGLGTAANLADAVLASREVIGGLTENDGERVGMGLFGLGLNAIQLHGRSHTPLDTFERPLPRLAESLTERTEGQGWWRRLFGEAADEEVEAASRSARTMLAEAGESEEVRAAKQIWNDPNASRAELVEAEQTLRYAGAQGLWQGGVADEGVGDSAPSVLSGKKWTGDATPDAIGTVRPEWDPSVQRWRDPQTGRFTKQPSPVRIYVDRNGVAIPQYEEGTLFRATVMTPEIDQVVSPKTK